MIVYYAHGTKETGAKLDRGMNERVKVDVRTSGEDGERVTTVKQFLKGEPAWLLAEGMEVPILVDPGTGEPLSIDADALMEELAHRKGELKQGHKEATSFHHSTGIPDREERESIRELPGDLKRAAGDLRDSLRASRRTKAPANADEPRRARREQGTMRSS